MGHIFKKTSLWKERESDSRVTSEWASGGVGEVVTGGVGEVPRGAREVNLGGAREFGRGNAREVYPQCD